MTASDATARGPGGQNAGPTGAATAYARTRDGALTLDYALSRFSPSRPPHLDAVSTRYLRRQFELELACPRHNRVWVTDQDRGYVAGWVVKEEGGQSTVALQTGDEVRFPFQSVDLRHLGRQCGQGA